MSFTFTTSGAALAKAGANRNTGISGSTLNVWSDYVEQSINAITRKDWIAVSGSTLANFKGILSDLASDLIAMKIINYDMSGYSSLNEATTMLDVLRDNAARNLEALKLQEVQEKM